MKKQKLIFFIMLFFAVMQTKAFYLALPNLALLSDLNITNSTLAGERRFMPATKRTAKIAEWERLKYGMFIHFGISTYTLKEIDDGKSPSTKYKPTELDTDQWAKIAREAGMTYAVLTAKHVAGHCLWDSAYTDYDVATSGNKTNVVKAFVRSCRKHKIKPGLYYCLMDNHHMKKDEKGNPTEEYTRFVKNQLTELLTNYGPLCEIWIDGWWEYQNMPGKMQEFYETCKAAQPDCLVVINHSFSKGTKIAETNWPTDITTGERTPPPPGGHNPRVTKDGVIYYIPMEVCDTLTPNWFWLPGDQVRPLNRLYEIYKNSVQRGANLLLDVPPDQRGKIPAYLVEALMRLKKVIKNPALAPKKLEGGKVK